MSKIKMGTKPRYHLLDGFRGFLVLGMVFYHLLFILHFVFEVSWSFAVYDTISFIQIIGASLFVALCGVSCTLSKNNFKRGVKIFLAAVAVTLVTALPFLGVGVVWFGILHLLAFGVLLFAVFEKLLKKVPTFVGILSCTILFFATLHLQSGFLGFGATLGIEIFWTPPLPLAVVSGINPIGFFTIDYFPVLPWVFMLLLGAFLGRWVPLFKDWLEKNPVPFLAFVGRRALFIYLFHVPVVFGLAWLLSR